MKRQWYCWIEGRQYGPTDESDLLDWIKQGRLHPSDHVWSEGMPEWTVAGNIPGLFPSAAGAGVPQPGVLAAAPMPPLAQPQVSYPGKGLCVASLVLGIASMPCLCCYGIGTLLGLVGMILGIVGIKQAKRANAPYGMGTAGVILSIIGLILGLTIIVIMVIAVAQGQGTADFGDFDFDTM